ncbi:hypothetical protein ACQKJG_18865 [Priestia megaterium]|uniref:hypothetical protein n=1 Tax=Priestia megaterium TaxID=1404 RepID=UPI003CFCA560
MRIDKTLFINRPFQLNWMQVSPVDADGVEYHLTDDLSLILRGIVTGERDFKISSVVLDIEGIEYASDIAAEGIFMQEVFPNKSKDRIKKHFHDGSVSCFFTSKQIEELHNLFETNNFISHDVSIVYQGKTIEDAVMLPQREFKIALDALDELSVVQGFMDYRQSRKELEEGYNEYFRDHVASTSNEAKQTLKDKLKKKGVRKKLATGFSTYVTSIILSAAKRMLSEKSGWKFKTLGVLAGSFSIIFEIYGSTELNSTIRTLLSDDTRQRGMYGQ